MADKDRPNLFQRMFGRWKPAPEPEPEPEKRPERGELAFGGTNLSAGIVADEHNADLKGVLGVRAAIKMRRIDAQVRAVEKVVSLPIRSTVWMVEEPKDASAAEKEAAELLRENMFGGMEGSFDDLIREASLAIFFGFRIPEIVWEDRLGVTSIAKIASRNPELVERWLTDRTGKVVGYLYAGNRPQGDGVQDSYGGSTKYERIPVPIEKTLHFAYDQENDNPQGFGLWRSMYPHYSIKQALYKIMAVGIERSLVGVPYGKLPSGAQADDKTALLTTLTRLRAAADGAFILPEGQEVAWFESSRDVMDAMPFLHHMNVMIAQAALAQFLNLGQSETGTQSLATVHAELFSQAEEANARWIEQQINSQLVKRWALYNYGEGLRPPVVMHKPIRARDLGAWTQALTSLVGGGLLHATVDDEQYLRDTMELPSVEREQLLKLEDERKVAETEKRQVEIARLSAPAPKPGEKPTETRKATEPECGHTFAEGDESEELTARRATESDFTERATVLLTSIQESYLAALRPLVEEAEDAERIAQGKPIDRLPDVPVPGRRRYVEFLKTFLWQVFDEGRAALAAETGQDAGKRPVSNRMRQWITARAEMVADDQLGQMKTQALGRILTGIREELPASEIFSDAGAALIEAMNRNTASGWNEAAAELLSRIGRD